jgi:5-methylcytosine-specific restriction endonuclease McrA
MSRGFMKFFDLMTINQITNKYKRKPEASNDGMYCRNCKKVVRSYTPPQINYLTQRSVCAECGWIYQRVDMHKDLKKQVLQLDQNECVYCSSKYNPTVDHIKPYFFGGSDAIENLVTACRKCNYRRGNQLQVQPMIYGRFRAKGL